MKKIILLLICTAHYAGTISNEPQDTRAPIADTNAEKSALNPEEIERYFTQLAQECKENERSNAIKPPAEIPKIPNSMLQASQDQEASQDPDKPHTPMLPPEDPNTAVKESIQDIIDNAAPKP